MTDNLLDNASDIYCHGIARIEKLGPNRRVIFTIPSVVESVDGYCRHVVAKLILPAELMATLAYMAAGADQTISPELIAFEPRTAN